MRKRTPKKDMAKKRTEFYQDILTRFDDDSWGLVVETKDFNILLEPWKAAAKECNLDFRKGCIFSGNNRLRFPCFYLPREIILVPNDLGSYYHLLGAGYWVLAKWLGRGKGYALYPVCQQMVPVSKDLDPEDLEIFEKALAEELQEEISTAKYIKKATLHKILDIYGKKLGAKVAICNEHFSYSGWRPIQSSGWEYCDYSDLLLKFESGEKVHRHETLDSKLSRILFALTLFSITKPLLTAAKLPTEFCAYLPLPERVNFEDYYYFHEWICFFCNPRKRKKYAENPSFERESVGPLGAFTHHNFPILYRKADPLREDCDPKMARQSFLKKELSQMQKASCLPILLSPAKKGKFSYPEELCLSIEVPLQPSDRRFDQRSLPYRDHLFSFYSELLSRLSKDSDTWIKEAKKYYPKALSTLLCIRKSASARQQQVGCILTALQLAETCMKDSGWMSPKLIFTVKKTLTSLVVKQVALTFTFAEFLRDLIDIPTSQSVLLAQDDQYLYLDFKEYWNAFEAYCDARNILIQETPLEYRRKYLEENYLKPQFTPKRGTYSRYDCYKVVNGQKRRVLVVKTSILSMVRKDRKSV